MKQFGLTFLLILAVTLITVHVDAKEFCIQSQIYGDFLKLDGSGKPDKKPYIGKYYCSNGAGGFVLQPAIATVITNPDGSFHISIIVHGTGAVFNCGMWMYDMVGDKNFNGTGFYDYQRFGHNAPDAVGPEEFANVKCSDLPINGPEKTSDAIGSLGPETKER